MLCCLRHAKWTILSRKDVKLCVISNLFKLVFFGKNDSPTIYLIFYSYLLFFLPQICFKKKLQPPKLKNEANATAVLQVATWGGLKLASSLGTLPGGLAVPNSSSWNEYPNPKNENWLPPTNKNPNQIFGSSPSASFATVNQSKCESQSHFYVLLDN